MTEFRISQPGKVDMDGADIVLYHFRTFKQKENMVPEYRNIVTHPWVFFDGYYFSQWSFTLIVEKHCILHDRKSCFISSKMANFFFFYYK